MVAYERWSLTRGGHKGRFDCSLKMIITLSFDAAAQILQGEEACGGVVCNVHGACCPQDDQNGQTPVLFQG